MGNIGKNKVRNPNANLLFVNNMTQKEKTKLFCRSKYSLLTVSVLGLAFAGYLLLGSHLVSNLEISLPSLLSQSDEATTSLVPFERRPPYMNRAAAKRSNVWNCSGTYTDAPNGREFCTRVGSNDVNNNNGNKFITPSW